jgi:hypothetical protein
MPASPTKKSVSQSRPSSSARSDACEPVSVLPDSAYAISCHWSALLPSTDTLLPAATAGERKPARLAPAMSSQNVRF